jgi:hypothetical protein
MVYVRNEIPDNLVYVLSLCVLGLVIKFLGPKNFVEAFIGMKNRFTSMSTRGRTWVSGGLNNSEDDVVEDALEGPKG